MPLNPARGFEFVDRLAVQGFHGDTVGGGVEHHLMIGTGERSEDDVLFDGVQREDSVERFLRRPALHRPDRPAGGDVNP
jgi:hypothetical protein